MAKVPQLDAGDDNYEPLLPRSIAVAGIAGAVAVMTACGGRQEPTGPINIVMVVDVLAALSLGSLQGSLYLMDNGPRSRYQGTANLVTACRPGQRINWIVYALDVQTPILIESITFSNHAKLSPAMCADDYVPATGDTSQWYYWAGTVPYNAAGGLYSYRLTFQMGKGVRSVISAETPSIEVLSP